jgi:hypothetical protein
LTATLARATAMAAEPDLQPGAADSLAALPAWAESPHAGWSLDGVLWNAHALQAWPAPVPPPAQPAPLLAPAPAPAPTAVRGAVPSSRRVRCQVAGCTALDGVPVRRFNARARACDAHASAACVQLAAGPSRLCVRCAVFHTLDAFTAGRRFCDASQARRNERRRVVYAERQRRAAAGGATDSAGASEGGAAPGDDDADADADADAANMSPSTSNSGAAAGAGAAAAATEAADDAPLLLLEQLECSDEELRCIAADFLGIVDSPRFAPPMPPPPAAPMPPPLLPPLATMLPAMMWRPQHAALKFPAVSPLALPTGLAAALSEALCGVQAAPPPPWQPGAASEAAAAAAAATAAAARPFAALLEGWVSPGCTLLRCDVAPAADDALYAGASGGDAGAAAAAAAQRLLAAAAAHHPDAHAFLLAQAFTFAWRGGVAHVAPGGVVAPSPPAAAAAPPLPLPRLPPPRLLAAVAGAPLTLHLAAPPVAAAALQCRFHGQFLSGVRAADGDAAALLLPALPSPGCAQLEYAPRSLDGAGPFAAPRPLLLCPSAAVADEINTLARVDGRSDASEALLWSLGAALSPSPRVPLRLAAALTALALRRRWCATAAALLPALRGAMDDFADARGDEAASAVLDAALGGVSLARAAVAAGSTHLLAAVLAAGGPEGAFGGASASDDDDGGDADADAVTRAPGPSPALSPPSWWLTGREVPAARVQQALRCYVYAALISLLSYVNFRPDAEQRELKRPAMLAAMPLLRWEFAASVYQWRVRAAQPLIIAVSVLGIAGCTLRALRRPYARIHEPLLVTIFLAHSLVLPMLGTVLAAREWGFGDDVAGGEIGTPLWDDVRLVAFMFAQTAFSASLPISPRLHAALLAVRGALPLAAHLVPWPRFAHTHGPLLHAACVAAIALHKWRAGAPAALRRDDEAALARKQA